MPTFEDVAHEHLRALTTNPDAESGKASSKPSAWSQWPMRHLIKTPHAVVAPPKRLAEHISGQPAVIPRLEDRRGLATVLSTAFPAA